MVVCTLVIAALGRQKQKDQEFKASHGYIVNLRSDWKKKKRKG